MGSLPLLEVVLGGTYLFTEEATHDRPAIPPFQFPLGSCLRGARSDELIRVAMEPKTDLPKR